MIDLIDDSDTRCRGGTPKYTNKKLLDYLTQFWKDNGRVPIANDFNNNHKYPNLGTYQKHFGSWDGAIEAAGLSDSRVRTRISDNELLEYLRQFHEENGRVPKKTDFSNNPKYPSSGTYQGRFGGWKEAIKMAGLDNSGVRIKFSDDKLLEYLRQFYEENGRTPTMEDFDNNPKCPGANTYIRRLGGWNKAIEMAGLDKIKFSDDTLLGYLIQFYEKTGSVPTIRDFSNNPELPGYLTYAKRFGSWQKALKMVELDVDSMVGKGILENNVQKGRGFEIRVLKHFAGDAIDVAGDNCSNPFDGVSPSGEIYDAKSVCLMYGDYWPFRLDKYVDLYYLGAFDKDYKKLLHVWRVSGDFIDGPTLYVGLNSNHTYNVENMKEYEITDKFEDVDTSK